MKFRYLPLDPHHTVGSIVATDGAVNASSDRFTIRIHTGGGGHAARPHEVLIMPHSLEATHKIRRIRSKIRGARARHSEYRASIMTLNFEKYAHTGRSFVRDIAVKLGEADNQEKAGRILRSTLNVLRDQSSPEESVQFISQLPMFIKALYVDGWKPGSNKGRVRHLDDFIAAVQEKELASGHEDFTSREGCFLAVKAVFSVIKEYVSEGEIEDLRRTLPEELKVLLD